MLPNDVHVIDLRDKTGKNLRDGKRLKRSVGDVELPEVVVELGPELTEGGFPSHLASMVDSKSIESALPK